jgi:TPR repeat protein
MVAMGDLYYYGAHGLPRNQPLALDYFQRAAQHGSLPGDDPFSPPRLSMM